MSLSRDLEAALFVVSFTYSFMGSGSFLDFIGGLCFHVVFRICFDMQLLNRKFPKYTIELYSSQGTLSVQKTVTN